jgi:2-polyprenyl-6-methoxyphenol hydroxylase-like FAD-dependent oxidoreductase
MSGGTPTEAERLIIGGGVGGLAPPISFPRQGLEVRVLERAESFVDIGFGIQLGPNATWVLDELGLLEGLLPAAVKPTSLIYMDAISGERITSVDLGDGFLERYRYPYVVVHRADLQRVMLEACAETTLIEIECGKDAVDVRQEADAAQVTCTDGTTYRAGAVIAADGLKSAVRQMIAPGPLRFDGFIAYRGTVPFSTLTATDDADAMVMWVGPNCHVVQYKVRAGELYNQVAAFRSPGFAAGEKGWGGPDELDAHFSSCCESVREGISLLSRDRHYTIADRDPIRRWGLNRIALLGDAAHPMLPVLSQGGCQALEDAVTVAEEMKRSPDDHRAALSGYERRRVDRAGGVQAAARRFADVCHIDGVGRELRNALFESHAPDDYRPLDWLYQPAAVDQPA